MFTLKNSIKLFHLVAILSLLNTILYHFPFFTFVFDQLDFQTVNGIFLVASLILLMLVLNAFVFFLLFSISPYVGRTLTILFFLANAIALYFVNTYSVMIDKTMVGNILNTNFEESSSFFSFKLVLYVVFLGIMPSAFVLWANVVRVPLKKFATSVLLTLAFILAVIFANASNWLWVDKHAKTLGALAMPWSYTVNLSRYYSQQYKKNKKEIRLPDIKITDNEKAVVVLVIGESARRQNFSLYGYEKNTNPLLSKTENLYHFNANSCATYTTAGVKCILEHKNSSDLYEILPNYLYRNDVEVVWRTSNWGEPPIHIQNYQKKADLQKGCEGDACAYDEVLLRGMKAQILASKKSKILIVLHTSTSHGPTYNKKYPPNFEVFKPVCNSVDLGQCSQESLMNAYDNTIVYTDYLLHKVIEDLQQLKDYRSAMFFVSDHGESLGENNLYMHGLPMSLAPKEQYEVPFIVWVSPNSKQVKPYKEVSQNYVFHSVMNFLSLQSPVYNEQLNIFK